MSHANLSPKLFLRRRLRRPALRRAQSGFSLLEAVVSIVILSFGLLGVAGLQASSLKYTRDASNQSIAVNLAREMAEMIRSNARAAGRADNPYLLEAMPLETTEDSPLPETCLMQEAGCEIETEANQFGNEVAAAQMVDWMYRVGKALPGAYVAVCVDSEPFDGNGVPKAWDDTTACDGNGNVIVIKMGWARDDHTGKPTAAESMPPYVIFPVTPAGQQ